MTRPQRSRNCDRPTFPSSNAWGIPDLLPDQLASQQIALAPLFGYRSHPLTCTHARRSLVHFFVDDYRFGVAWTYPDRLLGHLVSAKVAGALEPNFSIWLDAPRAEQLHAVYRSRWCARYWQEAGVSVVPVLNWSDEASHSFCFLGVPQHAPIVAVQCRTVSPADRSRFNQGLHAGLQATQPQSLLIYGTAGRSWIDLPPGLPVHWVEATTDARFTRIRTPKATQHQPP